MSDLVQAFSPDRLLSLNDVMFKCHVFATSKGEFGFQSSLAISSLLSNEFLVLFYKQFPKDFGNEKQNCQKCFNLTVE